MDTCILHSLFGAQILSRSDRSATCTPASLQFRDIAITMATAEAHTTSDATPVTVNELWKLFTEQVRTNEEEWVLDEVVTILKSNGITAPWQLKKAPDALLLHNFPLQSHARHYLVAVHVRDEIKAKDTAEPQPAQESTALAAAISGLMQEQRALRQSRKRSRSDPDTDDERSTFGCNACLWEYNLHEIPTEHLPTKEKMEKMARRGAKSYREHGKYLVTGPVTDYQPAWMEEPVKDMGALKTHARWVALWWARTFAQVAAQGHSKRETVSLTDLITQFLRANQAAIENSNKVGWEADKDLWSNISDKVKRNVDVDVREEMLKAPSENKKERLWKKLNNAKSPSSGSQQEYTGSSGKGGKDGGKTGKAWKN